MSGYITAEELRDMLYTVKLRGALDGETAERLIREHARLLMLSHDLIWVTLGCPKHKAYRGTTSRPPQTGCDWCRSLWEHHQEHGKSKRFADVMAEQQRKVNALLRPRRKR